MERSRGVFQFLGKFSVEPLLVKHTNLGPTGNLFTFEEPHQQEVIDLSSNNASITSSSMTSQQIALQRTLFFINQKVLYGEGNSTKVVTIVEVHNMDGKTQTIYTINFKEGASI